MQVQSINSQNIRPISFGIRPTVNVSKEHNTLLNNVADLFDTHNQKLDKYVSKAIRKDTIYMIDEYEDVLEFSQGGFGEHRVLFYKSILSQPAEVIAQILANTAEIFSHDDRLFNRTCKYVNSFKENQKHPKIPEWSNFEDEVFKVYDRYITPAIESEFNSTVPLEYIKDINL